MKRNDITEEVVAALCQGQNIPSEDLEEIRKEYEDMSDGFFLTYVQGYFMERPDKTDWKTLVGNLETLLEKCKDEEQDRMIKQYILEFFSSQIGDGKFDGMLIKRYLGPLSRAYLNEYEQFHGTNIRY